MDDGNERFDEHQRVYHQVHGCGMVGGVDEETSQPYFVVFDKGTTDWFTGDDLRAVI